MSTNIPQQQGIGFQAPAWNEQAAQFYCNEVFKNLMFSQVQN